MTFDVFIQIPTDYGKFGATLYLAAGFSLPNSCTTIRGTTGPALQSIPAATPRVAGRVAEHPTFVGLMFSRPEIVKLEKSTPLN
jgi:hypothetical protein